MKVSVVTSSFNQRPFLARCIESVLDQGRENLEYIVVDAGSTDGSRELIQKYASHIDRIIFEPDRGHSDGMNKGFRSATGDIYNCLNADDAFLPGAVNAAIEALQERPRDDVIVGNGYIVDADGRVRRRFISNHWNDWRFVRVGLALMHQATFYRREAFWVVGGFDPAMQVGNDGDLLYRMSRAGLRITRVNQYWGIFAMYDDSISGSGRLVSDWQAYLDRKFRESMGRDRDIRDWPLDRVAYISKWLTDPRALGIRLLDAAGFIPDMRFNLVAPPTDPE